MRWDPLLLSVLLLLCVVAPLAIGTLLDARTQDSAGTAAAPNGDDGALGFVAGHPFAATKFARRVRVSPDGKEQFISNERYPIRIARDESGRVMMQRIETESLPECDKLELREPPPCPVWGIFVIDPAARTDTHWLEGERAYHGAVTIPLSQAQLEEAGRVTSDVPDVPPDVDTDASSVTTTDLGDKSIDGISAHGVRTTVIYPAGHAANKAPITWIHEVWTASELKLIVRVVEGDPHGEETVWGVEKVSLRPDLALFQPPSDYELEHRKSPGPWSGHDFEQLKTWFAK
jgi:hypothetical protein